MERQPIKDIGKHVRNINHNKGYMTILNKYTIDKTKEFELTLGDDNNVIEIDVFHVDTSGFNIAKMNIYVIEDDIEDKHVNKFRFFKVGEGHQIEDHWMYICRIGDEFLFQKSSWER